MKISKFWHYLCLSLILVLALFLRFYRLDLNIPQLYADETGHYVLYNFVLGKSSGFWSFFYNKVFYGTFSLTWIFGLNPLGVRSAPALYGAITSLAVYFLAYSVSRNKTVSLVASLLTAISPWSYLISRLGHTHVVIIALLSALHAGLFLRAKNLKGYLVSYFFLFLTLVYYPSMVVIAPVVALSLFPFVLTRLSAQKRTAVLVSASVLSLFLGLATLNHFRVLEVSGRGLDLAIWRDVNTPYQTDKYRALSWNSEPSLFSFGLPPEQLANKLFLNRISANLSIFTKNYLSFFTPDWLFLKGDAILRHSTGMVGAFYPFLLPFMLYGAFRFFKTVDPKTRNLFLVWILVSPIPAALTKDGAGYLLRAVTVLPFLTYFCALGLVESFNLVRKNWRWPYGAVIAIIGLYSAWSFFYGYFHVYPALSARAYEYGFKELSDFQVASEGRTMLIVWDGYYHVGDFLFWQKVPLVEYEKMKITPIGIGETTFWKTLPNLYFTVPKDTKNVAQFIKDYQPAFLVLPDRYFVKYSDDLLKLTAGKVYEIEYPDKTTAFTIYTLK